MKTTILLLLISTLSIGQSYNWDSIALETQKKLDRNESINLIMKTIEIKQKLVKERAKEIYCKYTEALNIRDLQTTANPFAKQCALIAVEEILKARPLNPNYVDWDDCGATHQYWYEAQREEAEAFWLSVKSELNAL